VGFPYSGENKTHSFVVIPAAAGEFKDISGTGDYRRSKGATLTVALFFFFFLWWITC